MFVENGGNANLGVPDTNSKRKLNKVFDPTMELTAQEREWALAVKAAFENNEEILARAITDMDIATFAIIDQGNIERSCERAICMQAFKMQYNINDNLEEGMHMFQKVQEFCPGLLLSIEECSNEDGLGSHALVHDLACYYPLRFMRNPKDYRYNIGSIYYMITCTQPDIKSAREGFRHICECDGVSWDNANFKVEHKNITELLAHLPYRRRQIMSLRVPSVLLILLSLMRPLLPKEEYEAYCFGTEDIQRQFPERIDQFYLQPTPEEAYESLLGRLQRLLTRRFHNQRTFRL